MFYLFIMDEDFKLREVEEYSPSPKSEWDKLRIPTVPTVKAVLPSG